MANLPKALKQKTSSKPKAFDLTQFNFLWDYVLVQATRAEESTDGLIKPEQYDERPEIGIVIATGGGKVLDNGTVWPMPCKPGDTVFFGKYSSVQTRMNGEDYYLIRAEDICAVK